MIGRFRSVLAALLALFAIALASPAPARATDDLERSVALMAKIGSATSPSFSPDGKTLAFVSNLGGLPQVWTVDAAGGYPAARHRLRRSGGLRGVVAGRRLARVHARSGRRNERAGLSRPPGRHRPQAADRRRQGNESAGPLARRRRHTGDGLEPTQRRGHRRLRLRRRRGQRPARRREPRDRRLRGPLARREVRPPQPARQPRRQQPLPRRARDREGDAPDAA